MTVSTLKAAKKTAALMTMSSASKPGQCPNCVKATGLAILPLVTGLLPNRLLPGDALGIPEQLQLNAPLRDLSKALSADDLKHHWYYMRALPAGYLYILLPDDSWQSYLVDRSGLLRQMPPLLMTSPADAGEPMDSPGACRSPEHNPTALQFIVLDPEKTPSVWMAFSRYRWSQQVLEEYQEDKDGSRSARMTQVNVAAAARGENWGAGKTVPNGHLVTAELGKHVADYASLITRALIDRTSLEDLHPRGERVLPPFAKPQSATDKLAAQMQEVSKKTAIQSGVFLVLDDVVGHVMQLNYLRNRTRAEMYELEGVGGEEAAGAELDLAKKEKLRKRIIALQIEGIRKSAEQNPGPWYLRQFGPERYLKHIDQAAWQEALKEDAKHEELKQQELDTSADFCSVIQSSRWEQQQRTDFSNHPTSALGHEHMVACCVAGSGVTKQEQEELWDPVLDLPADDPDNWLVRALGSQNTSYAAHLAQTPTEQDDAYIAAKEAVKLTGAFLANGEKKIQEIRAAIRTQRAANANTATLIETSAGHLFRLRDKNPKAYRKLIRQVTLALITRADIVPSPTLMRGTWQQMIQTWMAVLHGDPRIAARAPVGVVQGSTTGLSKVNKPALSSAVLGSIVMAPPNTRQEATATVAWVVKKIEQGGHLDYDQLRKLKLTELDISARAAASPTQLNPVLQNHLVRMGRGADVVLSAGALFFQVLQGADVMKQYAGEVNPGSKAEADCRVGMTVSVLGALSASVELYVAVRVLGGVSKEVLSKVSRYGAWVGGFAGLGDGVYTAYKGWGKADAGDVDSGSWAIASGAAFAVGGVATILGFGGPIGWTLLAIGAIGAGLYFAWQAYATDDENLTPVEYWLDNGVFGKGEFRSGDRARQNPYAQSGDALPFTSLEDEILALQKVILVAQASFSDTQGTSVRLATYTIDLPRYAKGSRLEVKFYGYQNGSRLEVGEMICLYDTDLDSPGGPRTQEVDGKNYYFMLSEKLTGLKRPPELKLDKELGTAHFRGMLATVDSAGKGLHDAIGSMIGGRMNSRIPEKWHADSFGMTLKYWPNREEMPDLMSEFTYPVAGA